MQTQTCLSARSQFNITAARLSDKIAFPQSIKLSASFAFPLLQLSPRRLATYTLDPDPSVLHVSIAAQLKIELTIASPESSQVRTNL